MDNDVILKLCIFDEVEVIPSAEEYKKSRK